MMSRCVESLNPSQMTVEPMRSEIDLALPGVSDDGIGESNFVSGSQECKRDERSRGVDLAGM